MTKISVFLLLLSSTIPSTALAQSNSPAGGRTPEKVVPFEELHRLIREHLAETSDEEVNAAAVTGLIDQLKPHVVLGDPGPPAASTNALVARAQRHRGDFGYLRVGAVREGLSDALRESIDRLLEDGPLKGLILDLRMTEGTDYAAAAEAAGMFTLTTETLLRVGDELYEAKAGGEDILIPVMTLTNGETSGAAEALAAILRNARAGLIIGGRTAGEATLFESFTLSTGQKIRIASQPVQLGDGTAIPRSGIEPDLLVATTLEEDRRYLADPFAEPVPINTNRTAASRRRITEADLVRQRREGIPLLQIITNTTDSAGEAAPELRDPALVRGLDMLKALTVVQTWKKEP